MFEYFLFLCTHFILPLVLVESDNFLLEDFISWLFMVYLKINKRTIKVTSFSFKDIIALSKSFKEPKLNLGTKS